MKKVNAWLFAALALFASTVLADEICYPRKFSSSSVVCVCNSTHCGNIGRTAPEADHVTVYQSSLDGLRFQKTLTSFGQSSQQDADLTLKLRNSERIQSIIGFGGAFTDACGVNWESLPENLRDRILEAYYSPEGSEYNVGRIPMAGCDFSTRDYTYADTKDDFELNKFSLAPEDNNYKIPMIKRANKLSAEQILYYGSPWSPPAWMKDSNNTVGASKMIGAPGGPYYKTWAKYFVKFYEAYKQNGIDVWGFTTQNEPTTGFIPYTWQTMGLTPDVERDFIKLDLGPAIFNATNGQIKLMILDDQRYVLPWWPQVVYADPEAKKYVSGVGLHWYANEQTGIEGVNSTYYMDPSKFILATEACEGSRKGDVHVILGSWERAETYAFDILADLRNGVSGWVDWNLCLSMEGGPNWVGNFVDSPIIVDKENKSFYKQPMYYALAHFSKFLPRGSVRIADTLRTHKDNLYAVSFLRPDGVKAAVVLNKNDEATTVRIEDDGKIVTIAAGPRSISSVLWH